MIFSRRMGMTQKSRTIVALVSLMIFHSTFSYRNVDALESLSNIAESLRTLQQSAARDSEILSPTSSHCSSDHCLQLLTQRRKQRVPSSDGDSSARVDGRTDIASDELGSVGGPTSLRDLMLLRMCIEQQRRKCNAASAALQVENNQEVGERWRENGNEIDECAARCREAIRTTGNLQECRRCLLETDTSTFNSDDRSQPSNSCGEECMLFKSEDDIVSCIQQACLTSTSSAANGSRRRDGFVSENDDQSTSEDSSASAQDGAIVVESDVKRWGNRVGRRNGRSSASYNAGRSTNYGSYLLANDRKQLADGSFRILTKRWGQRICVLAHCRSFEGAALAKCGMAHCPSGRR